MSSPFTSYQEFSEAEGPIYTFANNPTVISILLVICLAIALYFLYASFTMKQENRSGGNPATAIGLLIVAGAASLLSMVNSSPKQPQVSDRPQQQRTTAKSLQPLALLGMVGIGRSTVRRKRRKSRRVR